MVYKFLDKTFSSAHKLTGINFDIVSENKQLAKELHKLIIKNLKKGKYTHLLKTIFEALI